MADRAGVTALLSDSDAAASLVAGLEIRHRPVVWFTNLKDLVEEQPLSSISVLMFHFRRPPKGILLQVIARMALEYPGMQMVAIAESQLPLPMIEHLTACGVDLIWAESKEARDLDHVASVVDRMRERTQWITARAV